MFGDIGWQELVLTLAILALIFGAGRVADIGGALGRGIREFRNEVKAGDEPTSTPATTAQAQAPAQEQSPTTTSAPAASSAPTSGQDVTTE